MTRTYLCHQEEEHNEEEVTSSVHGNFSTPR